LKRELKWPKPDVNRVGKGPVDLWTKGQKFVMTGGPHDGMLLRLLPQPYEGTDESGWDVVYFSDAVYRRPESVDPYMVRAGKPNKKRTNVPHMEHDPSDVRVPIGAAA
jgi:hypothetical protein